MKFLLRLFLSLLLCVGGGWISGLATEAGINDWYPQLNQPPGTPPNIVFPIIWVILYTLMAFSLTLLWSSPSSNKKVPLFFFFLQLGFNFSWSWFFFGLRSPGMALLDLLFLSTCLTGTLVTFRKHTFLGACLLLPYFAWIMYAIYLNLFIWIYN